MKMQAALMGLCVALGLGRAQAAEPLRSSQASDTSDASAAYNAAYIAFQEQTGEQPDDLRRKPERWLVATRGKEATPLEGADFYRALGRDDLALAYERRNHVRNALFFAGAGGVAVGSVMAVYGMTTCTQKNVVTELCEATDSQTTRSGAIVAVGGAALMIVSTFVDPHPVDAAQARRLAHEFNERLREKLGLRSQGDSPRIPGVAVSLSGATFEGGRRGIKLQVRF